mmetsp:Transcript_51292/g.130412  ORF Transcript_51292/g.130412 Transcript_51292/m.130412 type:complete len:426 (-) Transcript_51292:33-1310(-)|eukprot:CAMPEP_0183393934 /NCGR_PEP_ID=MMETSP0370-20130417/8223_1 /TAXON_ID=268820 /ORGANISM="Peridinium aciculiferum, Strain PAER-2" /LENGTH=425 /DNA_ID=CAMNT_0025574213 /DNA_START=58 /DNA_END=1335 /DNA_ORIENTATION=-
MARRAQSDGLEQPLLEGEGRLVAGGGPRREGTPVSAAVNLAATAMGTGVLTLPFAFARCGPMRCLLLLIFLAATTDVTLCLMIGAGRRLRLCSLGAILTRLFGAGGSLAFTVVMGGVLFLALTAMQRVVLDLLPMFVEELLGLPADSLRPSLVSLVVNVGVFFACMSKSYHSLRFTSGAALACLLPFVLAIVGRAGTALLETDGEAPARLVASGASADGLFVAAPLLASSLCCHFSVLDIDAELQPRYRGHMFGVIHMVSLLVLPLTYGLVALAGVALFGAGTAENILTSFHGDAVMQLARGVLSLTNALRMPLIVMPLMSMSLDVLRSGAGGGKMVASAMEARPWVSVALLLALSLGTASRMMVLTRVMGLLGGTGGVLGCFCLPGIMQLCAPASERTKAKTVAAVGAIFVGALVSTATALTWS